MRNIRLTVRYDGTAYHGWQIQKNAPTVQQTLEEAILSVTGETVRLVGCGRTDSGVHALAYVCNFKTKSALPCERLPHALNSRLPRDIVCIGAAEAEEAFHSKSSAIKKTYCYKISTDPFPDVFLNNRAWQYRYPLDFDAMRRAATHFVGTHDFVGFASSGMTVKTTVRTIYALELEKSGSLITVSVTGNGFLYNMVRIIVGTLVFVGAGKISPDDIPEIIRSGDRARAGITAPAEGLYLAEVFY